MSQPFTSYQPIKGIFLVISLFYCLVLRLPILALYLFRASNRQDPTWSWKQAVGIATAKFLFKIGARAHFARIWSVDRTPKNPQRSFIPGVTHDKLAGVLLDPVIKPVDIMGEWYPAPFSSGDIDRNTKVILFMFGGAYVMGDSKPTNYISTLKKLCPAINAKFFIIAYRLAGSAGGQPFPSQLQDLFSAYHYLLELGVASKNIILAGESAGGNAVISFLRHVEEHRFEKEMLPCAALLSSPWIDLTPDPWLRSQDPRYKTDFAAVELVVWGQQAFLPANRTVSDVYISPALKPFHSRVPVWLESGTGEVVFDALSSFVEAMKQAGTDADFFVVPHGTHASMWAAGLVGFDPTKSVDAFAAFLRERNL